MFDRLFWMGALPIAAYLAHRGFEVWVANDDGNQPETCSRSSGTTDTTPTAISRIARPPRIRLAMRKIHHTRRPRSRAHHNPSLSADRCAVQAGTLR